MEDKIFDANIREKMHDFQEQSLQADWAVFSQKLAADELSSSNQAFDDAVFEKMHAFEAPEPAADWDALAHKLDQADIPVNQSAFDQAIYEKIQGYVAPHPVGTTPWVAFSRYYTALREREYLIIRSKLAELALLLLALITLQHLPQADKPGIDENIWSRSTITPVAIAPPPPAELPAKQQLPAKIQEKPLALLPGTQHFIPQPERPLQQSTSSLTAKVVTAPEIPSLSINKDISSPAQDLRDLQDQRLMRELAGQPVPPLPLAMKSILSFDTGEPESVPQLVPVRRKVIMNVGMFGGTDYNQIFTPENPRLKVPETARYSLGYGGGIGLGIEYGRWELGAAMVYTAKQYNPPPITFIQGSFRERYTSEVLETVQLNMINVPLSARYNFLVNNKWRSYFLAGASLQMAYEANYYIIHPSYLPASVAITTSNASNFKNLEGGVFQNGSFKENSYITANLGFGVERFVSERWSIFTQPTYQQTIGHFGDGFGPYRDRISTLSLWTGVRIRFVE